MNKKSLGLILIAILLCVFSMTACDMFFSMPSFSQSQLMQARNEIRHSNIAIDTQYKRTNGWFSRTEGTSLGSGVVFDEDENYYYALTNYHVVTDTVEGVRYTTTYTITDINGYKYEGSVVGYNVDDDLAIVKFKKNSASILRLIDYTTRLNTNVIEGEFVLAVGNPSGVKNIVTYGEIIGTATINNVDYTVIYHNALINPGNSGGALCDLDGNLLGINTWGTDDKDNENFSIPLSKINTFIEAFNESQAEKVA